MVLCFSVLVAMLSPESCTPQWR